MIIKANVDLAIILERKIRKERKLCARRPKPRTGSGFGIEFEKRVAELHHMHLDSVRFYFVVPTVRGDS
jgi:hypothetical protein